jgi:hypothetical protein
MNKMMNYLKKALLNVIFSFVFFLLLSLVLGDKIDMKEIVIFSLVFGVVVDPLTDWIAKKYKLGL